MSLTIYGFAQSRAMRSLWMAEELKRAKGIAFEHDGRFFFEGELQAMLLDLNAMGQVPVIRDDDFVLAESMAINFYLAKKYDVLWYADPREEATALQWSFWMMTAMETHVLDVLKYRRGIMGIEIDEIKANEIEANLERPLTALEKRLVDRSYLVTDDFSVADLNVSSVFIWARGGDISLTNYPNISGWVDRCLARPALSSAQTAGS